MQQKDENGMNKLTQEKAPIYEALENTMDACEDVANAVEGVVMKNA